MWPGQTLCLRPLAAIIIFHTPPIEDVSMTENDMEKVQMYFEAALAVPVEKRAAFLVDLCGENSQLFHKVDALLQADAQSKAWDSNRVFDDATVIQPRTFQVNDEIGPYSIIEQIGSGGMGVIYRALDKRLQRHVAIKFLPAGMNSDPQIRQRFLAEARAASQLDHPNICVIHDVGETPSGQLYLTMPCYEGETLAKVISRGALPQLEAIEIVLKVAEGLASAHAHNIVHRDIKPANIMLTQDGGIKVLDFGIAKVANIQLTQTGMSIGTLAYMSPEQLRGEQVDARTDIWALGAVLFELLTGRQAFPAKALPDILQTVLDTSSSPLESVADSLPEALYTLLGQALAHDLEQRFANMDSMVDALYQAHQALGDGNTKLIIRAPGNNKPRSYQWDQQVLERITQLLLPILGPIAPVMVQRKAKDAADLEELRQQLVTSIPDQASREKFVIQLDTQLAMFTSPPVPRGLKTDGTLAGVDLSPAQRANIETALITHLGPVTPTLIKRHAVNATSLQQLCDTLAMHLNNQDDKQQFLQQMDTLFKED